MRPSQLIYVLPVLLLGHVEGFSSLRVKFTRGLSQRYGVTRRGGTQNVPHALRLGTGSLRAVSLPTLLFSTENDDDGDDSSSMDDSTQKSEKQGEEKDDERNEAMETIATNDDKPLTVGQRLKQYFVAPKNDDGLTFRQRLAKLGLAVVLSYGFVSNMSYCVSVSVAWYIFSKRVRICAWMHGCIFE